MFTITHKYIRYRRKYKSMHVHHKEVRVVCMCVLVCASAFFGNVIPLMNVNCLCPLSTARAHSLD